MARRNSQSPAWGYLLPLQDDLPPLELAQSKASVGTDDSCALRLPAAALGAAPGVLFQLAQTSKGVQLRSESEGVLVGEQPVAPGNEALLEHGTRVALGKGGALSSAGAEYVYVDRRFSESFEVPQNLRDKFFVGQRLGAGAFAKVHLLFDKESNSRRALKIVHTADESVRRYAEREVEILRSLEHPCVVKTYDVEHWDNKQFMVMEYLAGGDLAHYVKPNRNRVLSEAQTKLIFLQLTLAVSYLHEKNVCHRDLKPSNILLKRRSPYTLIKVTDFGLAKGEDDSSLKTYAGTQKYLAPEIADGKKYTVKVDVWSMGVILFLGLTGSLPFESEAKNELREDCWDEVSEEARALVRQMLKVIVSQRLSVDKVLDSLWLQDSAVRRDVYQLTKLESIRLQ